MNKLLTMFNSLLKCINISVIKFKTLVDLLNCLVDYNYFLYYWQGIFVCHPLIFQCVSLNNKKSNFNKCQLIGIKTPTPCSLQTSRKKQKKIKTGIYSGKKVFIQWNLSKYSCKINHSRWKKCQLLLVNVWF